MKKIIAKILLLLLLLTFLVSFVFLIKYHPKNLENNLGADVTNRKNSFYSIPTGVNYSGVVMCYVNNGIIGHCESDINPSGECDCQPN